MAIRRVLVLLKRSALDVYTNLQKDPQIMSNHQVVGNLAERHKTHVDTVKFCEDVLRRKPLEWKTLLRDELDVPISDVDLVITIGGDGTLLRASHYMDGSVPIFGVNSDPARIIEVKGKSESFDARRSTGYLCAATAESFEQLLDEILEGSRKPVQLSRILTCIDGVQSRTHALNDVLLAHPSPAAVTHCSFRTVKLARITDSTTTKVTKVIKKINGLMTFPLLHCEWGRKLMKKLPFGETAVSLSESLGKLVFACNFGTELVLKDFGFVTATLMSKRYGEEVFHATHDGLEIFGRVLHVLWNVIGILDPINLPLDGIEGFDQLYENMGIHEIQEVIKGLEDIEFPKVIEEINKFTEMEAFLISEKKKSTQGTIT